MSSSKISFWLCLIRVKLDIQKWLQKICIFFVLSHFGVILEAALPKHKIFGKHFLRCFYMYIFRGEGAKVFLI